MPKYKRTDQIHSMKNFIVLGTLLGILTTGIARAQVGGGQYVLNSLDVLLAAKTIACDLRIEAFVEGKKYTAWGQYAEQALPQVAPSTFLRSVFRQELNFSMNPPKPHDTEPNRMTVVCYVSDDGNKHQRDRYTAIGGVKSGDTIDLKRIEARLKAANKEGEFRSISEVRYLGGLAGMMRQISNFYEFSSPTQENLQDEETIPAWKLTGTLKSIHRKSLLEKFGGLNKKGHYPSDFPSDIEIWLGRHNDFPYQIRFLRRTSERSSQKTLLFQESFYKVALNSTPMLDTGVNSQFTPLKFPNDVFVRDDTDNFMSTLGL